ncbi:hypothetical protein D3C85_1648080 [compost metagenome]
MQHHRAALGEAGQDDARQVDAFGLLGLDQGNHLLGRRFQLRFVNGAGRGHGLDVVPAGHGIPAIYGDWAGRGLGHDEPGAEQALLHEFGYR